MNHVGESQFSSWVSLEKLSPRGKLDLISEKLNIDIDYGNSPWQVVPEIFAIRNKIAHGKNELLEDQRILSVDTYDEIMGQFLVADWQEYATQETAQRVRDKVEEICKKIWKNTNFNPHELFKIGGQTGSAHFEQ